MKKRKRLQKVRAGVEEQNDSELEEDVPQSSMPLKKKKKVGKQNYSRLDRVLLHESCIFINFTHQPGTEKPINEESIAAKQ